MSTISKLKSVKSYETDFYGMGFFCCPPYLNEKQNVPTEHKNNDMQCFNQDMLGHLISIRYRKYDRKHFSKSRASVFLEELQSFDFCNIRSLVLLEAGKYLLISATVQHQVLQILYIMNSTWDCATSSFVCKIMRGLILSSLYQSLEMLPFRPSLNFSHIQQQFIIRTSP